MERHDVKPFIKTELKDLIYKLNFITGYSVNNICEDLCTHAMETGVGKELSSFFKREIKLDGVQFPALKQPKKIVKNTDEVERISLKLNSRIYEYAYSLSFAMGSSIAKVIAYFLERSMKDYDFLNEYTIDFLSKKIDSERKDLMLKIISDVNKDYLKSETEDHSLTSLLIFIIDEYKQPDENANKFLSNFIS